MPKQLVFLSRHAPNDGQIALAKAMGYEGIKQEPIVFREDPIKDLRAAEIKETTLAIVAPSYITNQLLNAGYTLIEFVNSPIKREKMVFCCEGAYIYFIHRNQARIQQEFIKCPLSIEEQIESTLVPTESREVSE